MGLRDRQLSRVVWSCALGAGLVLILSAALDARACGDELVALAGYGATRGMGERAGAPEAALRLAGRRYALEGLWYGADKVESGAGYGLRGAAELRWRGLGAGLAYTHRNGGTWTKSYPWARVSAGAGPLRLIGEAAIGGYNRERRLEARLAGRLGRLVVEPRAFIVSHLQGTGWGAGVFVGLALGGARSTAGRGGI